MGWATTQQSGSALTTGRAALALDGDEVESLFRAGRYTEVESLGLRWVGDQEHHGEALIVLARASHAQGDLLSAIRWADRANRLSPRTLSIASFLGALQLAAGNPAAALKALVPFPEDELSPEAVVVRCRALRGTGQADRALASAMVGAGCFPISSIPLLAEFLDRNIGSFGYPGWYAVDIGHRLVGTVPHSPGAEDGASLLVRLETDGMVAVELSLAEFLHRFADTRRTVAGRSFCVELPHSAAGRAIAFSCGGQPLAGPAMAVPRRLRIEGDAAVSDDILSGWVWLPDLPEERFSLCVTDEGGHCVTLVADEPLAVLRQVNIGDGRYGFTLPLRESGLRPGRLTVRCLANGFSLDTDSLTGEPILWVDGTAAAIEAGHLAAALQSGRACMPHPERHRSLLAALRVMPAPVLESPPPRQGRVAPDPVSIDVIIPVYRGRDETLACIGSVLETVGPDVRVVVIDDASPDPELSRELAILAAGGAITLLVNPVNLGFPKSVNRGLAFSAGRDVVLLNSDTLVCGDWLQRLRKAAYARHDVGTVTPLSNDADILSYPSAREAEKPTEAEDEPCPGRDRVAELHALANRCNDGLCVEIPTAVAFCTFIRHDCLAETGALEIELFGRGYGEENDFCLRARRLGWRHVAAVDAFVAHVGGHSFGRRRLPLARRNLRALNARHPGYDALVRRFHKDNPLADARRRLDLAQWESDPRRPATLIVTFGRSGGVARFVEERVRQLQDTGRRVLMLVPADRGPDGGSWCRLQDPEQEHLRDLVFHATDETALLTDFLARAGVAFIEFQHYLDHDVSVLELPDRLQVPYDVYIHDYCWICPQICLIDASGRYCGEPDPSACARCIIEKPPASGETVGVLELRERSARVLGAARTVVAPSQDVAGRITRYTGPLPIRVEPWEDVRPVPMRPLPTGRRRVCVIGAIGEHKGYSVLLDCARDAARRELPLEFVVVGYTQDDAALFATGRIFITGPFAEEEALDLIERQQGHLAFLPSVCPETWSYALSHAWAAGLPVMAFDLGTIAERIGQIGGICLPFGLSPSAINDALLASTPPSFPQNPSSNAGSTRMLPSHLGSPTAQSQATGSAQFLTFQPGLYCVSVARNDALDGMPDAPFPLPSVHLAALPAGSGSTGSIEFMGANDGWLFRSGDVLVVKVAGGPRNLVLTSYQAPNQHGRGLDLQITRLDNVAVPLPTSGTARVPGPVRAGFRVNMMAHIQNQGDVSAPEGGWVGSLDQKHWMEGFVIIPSDGVPADCIEYKGLNANGMETAWIAGGNLCGSRGQGVPLTGLAIRLRGPYADRFDCVYEILFLSGTRSPAITNGQPYRSDAVGDPIQAFTLHIVDRAASGRHAF